MDKYFISDENMTNKIIAKFKDSGGAYTLMCEGDNGNPISVSRLLDIDNIGVLYIGMASNFSNRLADLKKSIAPKYGSSSLECGSRYKSNEKIASTFSFKKLFICLVPSNTPRETEAELMKKYESEFGELPPLNRNS